LRSLRLPAYFFAPIFLPLVFVLPAACRFRCHLPFALFCYYVFRFTFPFHILHPHDSVRLTPPSLRLCGFLPIFLPKSSCRFHLHSLRVLLLECIPTFRPQIFLSIRVNPCPSV